MRTALLRLLTAFLLLPASLLVCQQEPVKRLTHEQAVKDTITFLRYLEGTHPDPYTNLGGKIAFKRKAEQLIKDLPADGISVPDFTDRLADFLAPLKDGHTGMRGARAKWMDDAPPLPVSFEVASDGLLVSSSDLPELQGTRGYQVVAVDGRPLEQMMNIMSSEVSTENMYGTYLWMCEVLPSYKRLKNLLPDLDEAKGLTLTLKGPDGKTTERKLSYDVKTKTDPKQWKMQPLQWSGLPHSDDEFYSRFLPDGKTAYIHIGNMMPREGYEIITKYHVGNLKDFVEKYYARHKRQMPPDLDQAVQGIPSLFELATNLLKEMKQKNTPQIVIDLRGNGGGSTPVIIPFFYEMYGDAYFGRNSQAEFVQVKSELWMQQYNTTVEEQRKKDPNFQVGEYEFEAPEPGTAVEKREKKFAEWKEKGMSWMLFLESLNGKPLYTPKKIVVLCDPGTFSAAFQATFILHEMHAAVVGVPPAQSPNAFMEATQYVLPESGIHGVISNGMQMYEPKDPRINVLHPDFETSVAVYRKYGFDQETALRYALDLMSNGTIQ